MNLLNLGSEDYPLVMTTGRYLYQYHTTTLTTKSDTINHKTPGHYIKINSKLVAEKGIQDGDMVMVVSPRGSITTKAVVTDNADENVVFIPFPWAEGASVLTNGEALDKYCKIPGYKVTGVRLEKLA